MARSSVRQYLRRQRQAKRSWELTPEFIKEHPLASRLYVIFGGTIDECLAAESKTNSGLSKRALRAKKRDEAQAMERLKNKQEYELRQKEANIRHEERLRSDEKYARKFSMKQAASDLMATARRVNRKGIS